MKRRYATMLSGSLALAMAAALPAAANRPQDAKADKYETVAVHAECDGGTVTIWGDPVLWPPNHKYSTYDVVAVADDSADNVELGTSVTHDEYVGGPVTGAPQQDGDEDSYSEPDEENGAGNTVDDASPLADFNAGTGTVTNSHDLRSERSGRGDGRAYTFSFYAQFGDGAACIVDDAGTVEVPHDMRSDNAPEAKDRIGNG